MMLFLSYPLLFCVDAESSVSISIIIIILIPTSQPNSASSPFLSHIIHDSLESPVMWHFFYGFPFYITFHISVLPHNPPYLSVKMNSNYAKLLSMHIPTNLTKSATAVVLQKRIPFSIYSIKFLSKH